jgi:hypothetical protein
MANAIPVDQCSASQEWNRWLSLREAAQGRRRNEGIGGRQGREVGLDAGLDAGEEDTAPAAPGAFGEQSFELRE